MYSSQGNGFPIAPRTMTAAMSSGSCTRKDRLFLWSCLVFSLVGSLLNLSALSQTTTTNTTNQQNFKGYPPHHHFYSNRNATRSSISQHRKTLAAPSSNTAQPPGYQRVHRRQHYRETAFGGIRRSRTLMGIISSDSPNDVSYRNRHRELFQIWNDPRVCSLDQLRQMAPEDRPRCQLVYTFVVGAGGSDAPTLLVNTSRPILRPTPYEGKFDNLTEGDISLLNIRENMNDGKSPSFFYFASQILKEFDLDYAMKFDGDSIMHLHDWFLFAHNHLPPRPYSRGVVAGALRHKAFWDQYKDVSDLEKKEHFWSFEFEGTHLYLAGQCYLLSYDMCQHLSREAPLAYSRGYLEGHEDHDVGSMIYYRDFSRVPDLNETLVRLIPISKAQRFWEHPVKGLPRWRRIRHRENCRMNGTIFEGRRLPDLYLDE
eukprot:Nitzschia sp. Nitz4//scaffold2_size372955//295635//297075//NITZ4_000458-RA/size372955-processed-gene-0.446-mRNA-1//1//CDS//3329546883//6893//frame0